MTETAVSPCIQKNADVTYRLDLRLGIPSARLSGALEWWLGDPGLCRGPDQHPYLILLEIDSSDRSDHTRILQAVRRSIEESGSIHVGIDLMQEIPDEVTSLYQVTPSPGLCDFVFLLSRSFPVIANHGTLAYCIHEGRCGSFTALLPLRDEDVSSSGQISPAFDATISPLQRSGPENPPDRRLHHWPVRRTKPVPIDIFRIVLRKNEEVVAEFDLVRKEWLQPDHAMNARGAKESLRKYRIERGYQLSRPVHRKGTRIFAMSDLHLGHSNSIPRYKRPFFPGNVREMDRILIRNWNWTVKDTDTIVFLGDLSFRSQQEPEDYLQQLNGNILYVEGNHDPCIPNMPHCLLMRHRGVPYLLIHDPDELVRSFPGWVIHGHVHNKDLARYPFFDPVGRKINVSAEMVGYRPISFDEIHHLVTEMNKTLEFRDLSLANALNLSNPRISS
jgi:calcineurin-like phosphoesterase family protein